MHYHFEVCTCFSFLFFPPFNSDFLMQISFITTTGDAKSYIIVIAARGRVHARGPFHFQSITDKNHQREKRVPKIEKKNIPRDPYITRPG